MLGLRIYIGADIQENRDAAFGIRKGRGECHAIDRLQSAEQKSCYRHYGAGVAGADQPIGFRFPH